MEARAVSKFNRISPRKARIVADLIRGKSVAEALGILALTPKKASPILRKAVMSAAANARNTVAEDELVANAACVGSYLLDRLHALSEEFACADNPRGRGLMCAFDLPDGEMRDQIRRACYDRGLIILGCGERSLRFRPALTATRELIDEGLEIVSKVLQDLHQDNVGASAPPGCDQLT